MKPDASRSLNQAPHSRRPHHDLHRRRLSWAVPLCLAASTSVSVLGGVITLPAVNGSVRGFAAFDDTLYIAGNFTSVGGQTRNGVAAIDLNTMSVTSWNPDLGSGGGAGSARSIAVSADGGTVYFGGVFDSVGGTARSNLAAISSAGTLGSFAPTFNDSVAKVLVSGSSVYAIGDFTSANSTARVGFAGFDTSGNLTGFNPGLDSYNTGANYRGAALNADGSHLYVALGNSAKNFTDTDNGTVNRRGFASLQTTDGRETKFRPALTEATFDAGAFAVATTGNSLYVGGPFDTAQGVGVDRVIGFDSETFDATFSPETGTGPNGAVRSVSPYNGVVYLAGAFSTVNGEARKGLVALDATTGELITSWDAQSSTTLGGTSTTIFAHNGMVFVAGPDLDGGTATFMGDTVQYYAALTVVPEPQEYAVMLGGLALGWACWRRRQASKNIQ